MTMAKHQENTRSNIKLLSPVGGSPFVFDLQPTSRPGNITETTIINIMRHVAREFGIFADDIQQLIESYTAHGCHINLNDITEQYNDVISRGLNSPKIFTTGIRKITCATQQLLQFIISLVYSSAVPNPDSLNKYQPFSNQVYGETNFNYISMLIGDGFFRPGSDDIFIDFGSGIGQVVLQVAGSVKCKKCYGIEIANAPAKCASVMAKEFEFWMNWFGKEFSDFELIHGDFLSNQFDHIIKSASHLFINNYAFRPDLELKLADRLKRLNDGVKILAARPLSKLNITITPRNKDDIGSVLDIQKISLADNIENVSWTSKHVTYHLHTKNGLRVKKYLQNTEHTQRTGTSPPPLSLPTTTTTTTTGEASDVFKYKSDLTIQPNGMDFGSILSLSVSHKDQSKFKNKFLPVNQLFDETPSPAGIDQILVYRASTVCVIILYLHYEKKAYAVDGCNMIYNQQELKRAMSERIGVPIHPLRFYQQKYAHQSGSSGAALINEFKRLYQRMDLIHYFIKDDIIRVEDKALKRMRIFEENKREGRPVGQRLPEVPIEIGKYIGVCDGCKKSYVCDRKKLMAHILKCSKRGSSVSSIE